MMPVYRLCGAFQCTRLRERHALVLAILNIGDP